MFVFTELAEICEETGGLIQTMLFNETRRERLIKL